MSRILFLSQLLPYPPDAGPKVRAYPVLQYLAQKYPVTLLAFSRAGDAEASLQHLAKLCEDVYMVMMERKRSRDLIALASSLLSGESFIIRRDFMPEMATTVDRLLLSGKFEAVHADQLWMAQYALRAKKVAPGASLILDEHNACFQIFQRLALREKNPLKRLLLEREWRMMKRYEAQACAQFDRVVTVTSEDRAILEKLVFSEINNHKPQFATIPICVDTHAIRPVTSKAESKDVLHLGTMFWLPNVEGVLWFAREVWPKVIEHVPQATFTIAGKNPPAEIQSLPANQNGGASIQVTGYVPDPQPYLERAAVFIVPLLSGSGMRVKIVDAWRWGLPVVSTTIGAEGIQCRHGENLLIADQADDFARAVVQVLLDPVLSQQLRVNGRRWVEEHYDWHSVYTAWDSIYPS
jgi:polysaccharide biosynthesis protein PslH